MMRGETVLSGCTLATTKDFKVMRSGAGWYVGTCGPMGPITRETGYWPTQLGAEKALCTFQTEGYLPKQRT